MAKLFDNLPFVEAIEALRERLAIIKDASRLSGTAAAQFTGPDFLSLDAANRSRAFTMARISDQRLLENIHDELSIAINNGEAYAQFEDRLRELQDRSGWTGTSPWHYRLVYEQNLGMAFAAGRVQQGQQLGMQVWRYLPSISNEPREAHEQYYNNLYRMAPGKPVPPIDFNCSCGWEWVFPEELEAMGIDPATLPVFDPPPPPSGFVWSATDYFNVAGTAQANAELRRGWDEHGILLVAHSAVEQAPREVRRWAELATAAAAEIARAKFDRLIDYIGSRADQGWTLEEIREALDGAAHAIEDRDEVELHHQATLAALLLGMVQVAEGVQA